MAKGKKKKKVEKKVNKIRFYSDFAKNHTAEINERKNSKKNERKMWIRRIQARCNDGGSS